MLIEPVFAQIAQCLNGALPGAIRIVGGYHKEDYGWVEFIQGRPCAPGEEGRDYYFRLGALLALLHVLGAVDVHYENLIAEGSTPALIDLETVLQPDVPNNLGVEGREGLRAIEETTSSVVRIGLLPGRFAISDDAPSLELSGMYGPDDSHSPYSVPTIERWGTSDVEVTRTRVRVGRGLNRPTDSTGAELDARRYLPELERGFRAGYAVLRGIDAETRDGIIVAVRSARARFVLRPTAQYSRVLDESFHPDLLEDALDRSFYWEVLAELPNPYAAASTSEVIDYELGQLSHGDVPVFRCDGNSTDLLSVSGETLVPDFFRCSISDRLLTAFINLSDADVERQIWTIRAAFLADSWADYSVPTRRGSAEGTSAEQASHRRALVRAVETIVDDLTRSARVDDDGRWNWLAVGPGLARTWTVSNAGSDHYAGRSGAAMLYSVSSMLLGDMQLVRRAEEIRDDMEFSLADDVRRRARAGLLGTFSPLAALIDIEAAIATARQVPARFTAPLGLLDEISWAIEEDDRLDYGTGTAGTLIYLCKLHTLQPSLNLGRLIEKGVRKLVDAQISGHWVNPHVRTTAGVAHGQSGIAMALMTAEFATTTNTLMAIEDALAFEDGQFADGAGSTMDDSWCSGESGIAFARRGVGLPSATDSSDPNAIDLAVELLDPTDLGLCHGLSGRALMFRLATRSATIVSALLLRS